MTAVILVVVVVDGLVVDVLVDVGVDDRGVTVPGQVHSVCRRTL